MQVFGLKSHWKVDFLQKTVLICQLLGVLLCFEGLVDHGTDEVVEAEITLWGVGGFVYRGLRVWMCAASGWKLGFVRG